LIKNAIRSTRREALEFLVEAPEAVQLSRSYDAPLLQRDLASVGGDSFLPQRATRSGRLAETDIHWRVLPLRSPGGDPTRTDVGFLGTEEHKDTVWLGRMPYVAGIIRAMPWTVRSARLMSLQPGAFVKKHRDTPYGFSVGWVRLHIPIVTNEGAYIIVDGVRHHWKPGSLWYGDFSRFHSVHNFGDIWRVHLVMDCNINDALLSAFPSDVVASLDRNDLLMEKAPAPLARAPQDVTRGSVCLPRAFLEGSYADSFDAGGGRGVQGQFEIDEAQVVLSLEDGRAFRLIHIGDQEFRLAGWTAERTLKIDTIGECLVLRFRLWSGTRYVEAIRPVQA